MEFMEDMSFTMENENGEEVTYDVVCMFDSDETGKSYVIYTDNSTDEEGYARIFASVISEEGEDIRLSEIESDEEWDMVQNILDQMPEEAEDEE